MKLTGDGTTIGKRLRVANFAFTILKEGDRAYGSSGSHCIAIFEEPEIYESMKICHRDIIRVVEHLNEIQTNSETYSIKYYLGGDWKFLAMITGIDSSVFNIRLHLVQVSSTRKIQIHSTLVYK